MIRTACLSDLDALLRIEADAFPGDRLDRRNFRHAIRSGSMSLLVFDEASRVEAYVLSEFRRGARVARISSLAVAPFAAGRGLGRMLLGAAEVEAGRRGCDRLRLEVRADNAAAVALYRSSGYLEIGRREGYYDDGEAALRYEKAPGDP